MIEPRDLFSANQIIHLRPIMGHAVFAHFVKSNGFVRQIYPNFELKEGPKAQAPSPKPLIERVLSIGFAQVAEGISRSLYGWHLRRRSASWQSKDQVRLEAECLKLHTSSHRASTMARFDAAMKKATTKKATTKDTKSTKVILLNTGAA